jgi:hypothetical protein
MIRLARIDGKCTREQFAYREYCKLLYNMLFCSGMGILLSDDIKLSSLQIKMNSFKNGFQESLSSALYIIRQLV